MTSLTFSNFYKGFSINLVQLTIYWTFSLTTFETLHNFFNRKKQNENFEYYLFPTKMCIIFGATSLNAILASSIVYPFDTLKRHLQVNESLGYNSEYSKEGLVQTVKKFVNQEGLKGVYAGCGVNILKIMPVAMIQYCLFSYTISNSI